MSRASKVAVRRVAVERPSAPSPGGAGLTFRGWLHLHRGRDDYLGDLARFAWGGAGCRPACRFTDAEDAARHLAATHDPPASLLSSLKVAMRDYRAYARTRGGRP